MVSVLKAAGMSDIEIQEWLRTSTPLLSGDTPETIAWQNPLRALIAAQRFAARRTKSAAPSNEES